MRNRLPILHDGGIIVSYQCTNRCRHCLYNASPSFSKWMDISAIDDFIGRIKNMVHGPLHIGGGEPFIKPEITLMLVKKLLQNNMDVDYIETNGFWSDDENFRDHLTELFHMGLRTILISLSPFHNEFIPFKRTLRAIELISKIFTRNGTFIWVPDFIQFLNGFDASEKHSIHDYIEKYGSIVKSFPGMYYLNPGGRIPYKLDMLYERRNSENLLNRDCRGYLMSGHHHHIDMYGNIITGLCSGISIGNIYDSDFDDNINLEKRPLLRLLLEKGLAGLYNYAKDKGFTDDSRGYISSCHLCNEIRLFLREDQDYFELNPEEYYIELNKIN